jgi:hypothetical protein
MEDSGYRDAVSIGGPESQGDAFEEIEQLREKIARLEERVRTLDALAHQDALVSVPNRRGFMRELEALIGRVSRYGESAAMLYVDIDGLKRINDSFGHKAGDEEIVGVEIPTGEPLVYELNDDLSLVESYYLNERA